MLIQYIRLGERKVPLGVNACTSVKERLAPPLGALPHFSPLIKPVSPLPGGAISRMMANITYVLLIHACPHAKAAQLALALDSSFGEQNTQIAGDHVGRDVNRQHGTNLPPLVDQEDRR
jgi:hypothetical protein